MSTREDLEHDIRIEEETEVTYFMHENFHFSDDPKPGCWLCERDAAEDAENEEVPGAADA